MPAVARVGDVVSGYCDGPGHPKQREFTGVWITGSSTGGSEDEQIVCVGDLGVTDCDHHFVATSGSDIFSIDSAAVHRVGDVVEVVEGGNGTTVSGSDVLSSE